MTTSHLDPLVGRRACHGRGLGPVLLTALAGAAILLGGCTRRPGAGSVRLVYAVDQTRKQPGTAVNMDALVAAVRRRVNPGGRRDVTVRPNGPEQIEIVDRDLLPSELPLLKAILAQTGNLEFRILASRHFDQAVAERAEKAEDDRLYDPAKQLIARWVPIHRPGGAEAPQAVMGRQAPPAFIPGSDDVVRNRVVSGVSRSEVLVKIDRQNVTGLYFQSVTQGNDHATGTPDVRFALYPAGASKFFDLTSHNLPDLVERNFAHRLAIILDDEIWTAPNLQCPISDRGVITFGGGRPAEQVQLEIETMVNVLNAGALPAPLTREPLSETYTGPNP